MKATVFVSYSHEDVVAKQLLDRLIIPHLKAIPELRDIGIDLWDDTRIRPGTDWLETIRRALQSASAGLLLVSKDFLNSRFITEEEVPALLWKRYEEGIPIIPIEVRPVNWSAVPWLDKLQRRPKDGCLEKLGELGQEEEICQLAAEIAKELREQSEPEVVPLTESIALIKRTRIDEIEEWLGAAWPLGMCNFVTDIVLGNKVRHSLELKEEVSVQWPAHMSVRRTIRRVGAVPIQTEGSVRGGLLTLDVDAAPPAPPELAVARSIAALSSESKLLGWAWKSSQPSNGSAPISEEVELVSVQLQLKSHEFVRNGRPQLVALSANGHLMIPGSPLVNDGGTVVGTVNREDSGTVLATLFDARCLRLL